MATYFFDSSALVKRYAREAGTAWMLGLFRRAAGHRLYVARITGVEVTAALARKARGKHITMDAATRARMRLQRELEQRFYIVEITPGLLDEAMMLATTHGLRGYDAVQMAAALTANRRRIARNLAPLVLVTADTELLTAGTAEGLATDDPNNH